MIASGGVTYFSESELACKATKKVRLASGFADYLMALRLDFGEPMMVTSCCRSKEHNHRIGGHPRSLHVYDEPARNIDGTCAIDVRVFNPGKLVHNAWELGWSIGVNRGFIHLDRRDLVGLDQKLFGY